MLLKHLIHHHLILLSLIVLISLLFRINHFYTVPYTEDGSKEALIANHIFKYQEFPLLGPSSTPISLPHPPIYYYILALLSMGQGYNFLSVINLFLHNLNIVIIYLIARLMFGKGSGLLAAIFFGFNQTNITHSSYLWAPYFIQPFINLSFLLLLLSYIRKSFPFLFTSIVFFLLSVAFYYSNIAILPLFFTLVFLVLRTQKRSGNYYILVVLLFGMLTILVEPLIVYYGQEQRNIFLLLASSKSLINFNPSIFLSSLDNNLILLLNKFFPSLSHNNLLIKSFVALFITSIIIRLFQLNTHILRRRYFIIILVALLQQIFFVSLLKEGYDRYFFPIFGLLTIVSVQITNIFSFDKRFFLIGKNLIVIFMLGLYSPLIFNYPQNLDYIKNSIKIPSALKKETHPAILLLKQEIYGIAYAERLNNLNFFRFKSYHKGMEYDYIDAFFWLSLEEDLSSKLTRLKHDKYQGFETINSDKFIFINCYFYNNPLDEQKLCIDLFLKQYSNYTLVKPVFSQNPFSIYLFKKIDS